jgi:hypothetical protein
VGIGADVEVEAVGGAGTVEEDAMGAVVGAAAGGAVDVDATGAGALGVGALSQFLNGFCRRDSDSFGWWEGANTSSWPGLGACGVRVGWGCGRALKYVV